MSRSSDDSYPEMLGMSFIGTQVLLRLITQASHLDKHWLMVRYSEKAKNFDKVLSFLTTCKIIFDEGNRVRQGQRYALAMEKLNSSVEEYNKFLVQLILSSRAQQGEEIRKFFSDFESSLGTPKLALLPQGDNRYIVRNTLIEAGIIVLDHDSGICKIPAKYHCLYSFAKHGCGKSPDSLERQMKRNLDIGTQAELSVIEYEREILGDRFADQVVHIAEYNTSAGFDVASVRIANNQVSENRLIEVKAVSPEDYGFFLTEREHDTAKHYGEQYYLYLVPVQNQIPAIRELEVICNPAEKIIENNAEWLVTYQNIYCRKINSGKEI